jgi:hypothetical protein
VPAHSPLNKRRSDGSWSAERLFQGKTFVGLLVFILIPTQALWLLNGLDLAEKLGLEAVVVAIAAVAISIRHANELAVVADELQGVARSVPTRGIGIFPSYLSEVPELISRAKESITVLCDTPAHGAFSNTAAFAEYWKMLRHLMVDGNVSIKCKFFNASGRELLHKAQIKEDSHDWASWSERNRENCEAFDQLARHLKIQPPGADGSREPGKVWAETPKEYVESMMAINEAVLSGFDKDQVELLKFNDPLLHGPSVYCWLRDDDQEAVFVIVPVQGIGVRNLAGFHTREPELIRALGTVFEHYKGVPYLATEVPTSEVHT